MWQTSCFSIHANDGNCHWPGVASQNAQGSELGRLGQKDATSPRVEVPSCGCLFFGDPPRLQKQSPIPKKLVFLVVSLQKQTKSALDNGTREPENPRIRESENPRMRESVRFGLEKGGPPPRNRGHVKPGKRGVPSKRHHVSPWPQPPPPCSLTRRTLSSAWSRWASCRLSRRLA